VARECSYDNEYSKKISTFNRDKIGGNELKSTFLVFNIGNSLFGIDIQHIVSIEKVSNITDLPQMPEYIKGIVNLRGQIMCVIDSSKLLYNHSIPIDENTRFILLEINRTTVALMVPKTNEILDIDLELIKTVDSIGTTVGVLKGVALLENRMISIINLEELFSTIEDLESIQRQIN
jgi:purine-binding chemotaxis protein CheW